MRFVFSLVAVLVSATMPATAVAAFVKHQDIQSHTVPGSIFPPVLGATWTVDSRLNILPVDGDPHVLGPGGRLEFLFREFYNLTASSFSPLIVPGTPNIAPTDPGDRLDGRTWTFVIRNEGCGVFDYSTPWMFEINPNLGSVTSPEFELSLEVGPVTVGVNWGGGSTPPTIFTFVPGVNELRIEFTTSDLGQGFFGNGGMLSIRGAIMAMDPFMEGVGRVFATNPHYASGRGPLVDDYTFALPDPSGNPAVVTTMVFDDYTCVVPEPTSLILGLFGALGWAGYARRCRWKQSQAVGQER